MLQVGKTILFMSTTKAARADEGYTGLLGLAPILSPEIAALVLRYAGQCPWPGTSMRSQLFESRICCAGIEAQKISEASFQTESKVWRLPPLLPHVPRNIQQVFSASRQQASALARIKNGSVNGVEHLVMPS